MAHPLRYTRDDMPSRALAQADPELGAFIDRVGVVEGSSLSGAGFEVIARSIISQQLSEKAAATIWRRLAEQIGTSAEAIAAAPETALRAAGLSGRKTEYLQGIARSTVSGEIDWKAFEGLTDDLVVAQLTSLRGVGRWTAEMYLIFALGRPDVLALDDQGLRNTAGKVFGLGRPATRAELEARGERWRPWRSVASLWLWAGVA